MILVLQFIHFIAEIRRRNNLLFCTGLGAFILALFLISSLPLFSLFYADIIPWLKPIEMSISFGIYLWCMAWFLGYLHVNNIEKTALALMLVAFVSTDFFCTLLQMASSHPLKNFFCQISNAMTLSNGFVTAYIAFLFFTHTYQLPKAYLWGIRLGFVIFLLLNFGEIISQNKGWGLPNEVSNNQEMLGIHALLLLPLAGYFFQKFKYGTPLVFCLAFLFLLFFVGNL